MGRSLPGLAFALGPKNAVRQARRALREAVYAQDEWHHPSRTSDVDCILIGGCGRSGTTLLREILSRHPRIACGPESGVLCDAPSPGRLATMWERDRGEIERMLARSASVLDFAETFFGEYAAAQGKPRWADKTPRNVREIARLLALFPNARFIHVLRDGRDVACSLRTHPRQTIRKGRVVDRRVAKPIEPCAERWLHDAGRGLAFRGHPRVTEARYEDLVNDPESACRSLCQFLSEDFEPAMVESGASGSEAGRLLNNPNAAGDVQSSSKGRWLRDMTVEERRSFHRIAGELLIAAGYEQDAGWLETPVERKAG